ncbi:MAG TPA: glutathione S-transferase family protein [Sphingomicrobium sp.]
MTLALYAHPFSSYCQKVLIALWADGTEFEYRLLEQDHPENMAELKRRWPFGQFPVLVDNGETVAETSCIIEHLQARHPGPNRWIPDGDVGRRVRFLDRFFDLYVMNTMTVAVFDAIRPSDNRDPYGVAKAMTQLRIAYDWLEAHLDDGPWAVGDAFTLADCAAAPALFYSDWVDEIGAGRPRLSAYRARLLAHPTVARAVDDARPYRSYFPLAAPDRD